MVRDTFPTRPAADPAARGAGSFGFSSDSPEGQAGSPAAPSRAASLPASRACSRVTSGAWRKRLTACLLTAVCWLVVAVASPGPAYAQQEQNTFDARLEGFVENDPNKALDQRQAVAVGIEKSGTALTWILFLVLIVIACGPLFKNAKRGHIG